MLAGCSGGEPVEDKPGTVRGDATSPVEIPSSFGTASTQRPSATCRDFLDALPNPLDEAPRRDVRPSSTPVAAFGDPAIFVRCDAPRPDGFDAFSPCQEVNGIGWYAPETAEDDQADGADGTDDGAPDQDVTLTTIGIRPRVSVTVPTAWRPPAGILVDISDVVRRQLTETRNCL